MSTLQERIEELMRETGWATATQVANAAGVSRSAAAQWLGRGSKDIKSIALTPALQLEAATGYRAAWISHGEMPKRTKMHNAGTSLASAPIQGVFSIAPDDRSIQEAPRLEWRDLESGMEISGVAWVVVGSDEMAPRVRAGDQVLIDPAAPLEPGRLLLCEDAAGVWHVREYQDLGAGRWQAVAADSRAWAPLAGAELRRAVRVKRLSLEV